MAGPITWRNVQGPDTDRALRPLGVAQNTFNGAFDALQNVLAQRQALDTQNWNQTKENNTNQYLDAVDRLRTPEQIAAAQADGSLAALRAGFGAQINQAATRGAMDARTKSAYDQTNAANTFNDALLARREAPIMDEYKLKVLNKDVAGAQALVDANPWIRDRAGLAQFADTRQQQLTERERQAQLASNQQTEFNQRQADLPNVRERTRIGLEGDKLDLANKQITFDETKRNKALDEVLSIAATQHRQRADAVAKEQGNLAREYGLPVTSDGRPDMNLIQQDPSLLKAFTTAVQTRGLNPPSDTVAANTALDSLLADGKITAVERDKLRGKAELFSTGSAGSNALVGNDKETATAVAAATAKRQEEAEKTNSLFVTNKNAIDKLPDLDAQLAKLIPDDASARRIVTDEVKQYLQKNPDGVLHLPAILTSAANSGGIFSENGNFFRTNFRKRLETIVDTDAYRNQVKEYLNWDANKQTQRSREDLLRATRNPGLNTK